MGPTLSGSCPCLGVPIMTDLPLPDSWPGPQVRAMQRPPPGVKLVIEAVCIMKGIKPKKVPGEKPGSKVDDYWEPGKGLLQDPGRFLESLFKFDKVCVPGTHPAGQKGAGGDCPLPHRTGASIPPPSASVHIALWSQSRGDQTLAQRSSPARGQGATDGY